MGDERGSADEDENPLRKPSVALPSAPGSLAPRPVTQPPRPVSVPPRPAGSSLGPAPRRAGTPPPPPVRSHPSQAPPPPPLRSPPPQPLAQPSGSQRPPPPSMRPAPPSLAPRPPQASLGVPEGASSGVTTGPRVDSARIQELLSELMGARQDLAEKSTRLRQVESERNALRARLVQAENAARELSSALRGEARLQSEFIEAHVASSAALRARIAELELSLAEAKATPKPLEQGGLRAIRGIGPAFERALFGLGITSVAELARLSPADVARIAPLIKAQAERIEREDWLGQARRLSGASTEE